MIENEKKHMSILLKKMINRHGELHLSKEITDCLIAYIELHESGLESLRNELPIVPASLLGNPMFMFHNKDIARACMELDKVLEANKMAERND